MVLGTKVSLLLQKVYIKAIRLDEKAWQNSILETTLKTALKKNYCRKKKRNKEQKIKILLKLQQISDNSLLKNKRKMKRNISSYKAMGIWNKKSEKVINDYDINSLNWIIFVVSFVISFISWLTIFQKLFITQYLI